MEREVPFGSSEYDESDLLTNMPFVDQYWYQLIVSARVVREGTLPPDIVQYHMALLRNVLGGGENEQMP